MGYLLISESLRDFTLEIWISVLLSSLSPPKRDVFNEESAVVEYDIFIPGCHKKYSVGFMKALSALKVLLSRSVIFI